MSDGTTNVTFEEGYDELKGLVAELDEDGITVHEMCEKYARGKGLERALRAYLDEQQGKLEEIEGGRNLPEFRIVAQSSRRTVEAPATGGAEPDLSDFDAAGPSTPAADDDIPF